MKYFFLIAIIFQISSCTDSINGKATPENLIPRDSIVLILKDMALIESHIQTKYLHVSRFQKTMKMSGKKILDHYSISHKRFEESIDYYGSRQEEMQSIYSQILDSLNKEASLLNKDVIFKDTSRNQIQPQGMKLNPVMNKKIK
jgi:hypothetical protein